MKIAGAGGSLGERGCRKQEGWRIECREQRWVPWWGETEEEASRVSQAVRGAHHTHSGHCGPRAALITKSDGHVLDFLWPYSLWEFFFNMETKVKVNLVHFEGDCLGISLHILPGILDRGTVLPLHSRRGTRGEQAALVYRTNLKRRRSAAPESLEMLENPQVLSLPTLGTSKLQEGEWLSCEH